MLDQRLYDEYLTALLKGDRGHCTRIVKGLIDQKIPIKELYLDLFQASMYHVGCLWEENKISVAVEHMATAITEGLLNLAYPLVFNEARVGRSAVISCVSKEYHQIGAKMVADFFELNGWDGYFLGANTPAEDLLGIMQDKKPDLLGLSLSLYFNLGWLKKIIQTVQHTYPQQDIIVGGQGLKWGGLEALKEFNNVVYVESVDQLEKMIKG